jgi:hypothetical protein
VGFFYAQPSMLKYINSNLINIFSFKINIYHPGLRPPLLVKEGMNEGNFLPSLKRGVF